MADVQDVEAAVGEDDPTAPPAGAGETRRTTASRVEPLPALGAAVIDQVAEDLLAREKGDPDLLDLQTPATLPRAAASS